MTVCGWDWNCSRSTPETRGLLTNFVILYGASGRQRCRNGHRARAQPPQLPVQVETDGICAWAIAEDVNDQGAVLLLPARFPEGARIRLAAWGNGAPREARVVRWESLKKAQAGLFRVEVSYLRA